MKKYIPILFLGMINILAATFMIHESAGYYSMLYPENLYFIPWIAAVLAEAFQHIMMIMSGEKNWQTWIFRGLAGLLFILTVLAAGYRVYKPIELAGNQAGHSNELLQILKDEVKDNRKDRELFLQEGNKQKTNAAIAARERRKSSDELKELLKQPTNQEIKELSPFEIFQMFFLRMAIQITALGCAWKIGSIYRQGTGSKEHKIRKIVKRWKAKRLRAEQGFVGIVQYNDGSYLSVTQKQRKSYKTFNGAIQFFTGTKYEGKIPIEPTEVSI